MRAETDITLTDLTLQGLHLHRAMTTSQLHRLFGGPAHIEQTRHRLRVLQRDGLVDEVQRRNRREEKVWFVTSSGSDLASVDADWARRYLLPTSTARRTNRNHLAHTLAVNEIGLAFAAHAAATGDGFDHTGWEHEVAHGFNGERGQTAPAQRRRALIVDAVVTYEQLQPHGARLARRFVEMDRATEPLPRLHDKIRRYGAYRSHRRQDGGHAWSTLYDAFPPVLVVIGANNKVPNAQHRRRLEHLIHLIVGDPVTRPLDLLVATFDDLVDHGPACPIWWRPGHVDPVDFFGEARP